MMRDRLAEAIQLREMGRARQDQAMLEEARTLLLDLAADYPDDAEITFQTAVISPCLLASFARRLYYCYSGGNTTDE